MPGCVLVNPESRVSYDIMHLSGRSVLVCI